MIGKKRNQVIVAKKALDEDLGARGLNTYITETTWQAFDEVTSNPGVYEEVILTEETVENGEKFEPGLDIATGGV